MNVIVAARDDLDITKIPGDSSEIIYRVSKNAQLRVIGITKVGLNRVYNVQGGGYVDCNNVKVLRDNDFYHAARTNKTTRNFVLPANLSTIGGSGLAVSIGKTTSLTDNWYDLQKFAPFGNLIDVGAVGGGFGGGITLNPNRGRNPEPTGVPDNSGTQIIPYKNTTIPATIEPRNYDNTMMNMGVGDLLGANSGMAGQLLNGVQVGNFFDGTALDNIIGNALGMLGGWASTKLQFVIGFGDNSILSALFQAFGTGWEGLIQLGINSLLGIAGNLGGLFGLKGLGGLGLGSFFSDGSSTLGARTNGGVHNIIDGVDYGEYMPTRWCGPGIKLFNEKLKYGEQVRSPKFNYSIISSDMITTFQYRGTNGSAVAAESSNSMWGRNTYGPSTAEPRKVESEVAMWKDLYDADYSELTDSLDLIKNEFNLNIERKTLFVNFNRYRVPVPDHELNLTRGYIFFTRPDLNITATDPMALTNRSPKAFPLFGNIIKAHSVLGSYLMGESAGVNHDFIPILTHCCTGIDVSDEVLETTEVGETYTGWKYNYGTSLIKSKTAGNVTVTFKDDDMLSVYKIMKVWCEYISAAYRGEIMPKAQYGDRHILDYAISIYYFLCKSTDNADILFWTKYTGCFPTSIPSSNFSDSLGNPVKMPTYSIPFVYARKDDYNPLNIAEFNNLCSDTSFDFIPNYNPDTLHVNKSFVGPPFVDTNDGSRLFTLKFRPK